MITSLDPIPAYFFPYEVPVTPNVFPTLAFLCSILGLVFFAWFFTLQVTTDDSSKIGRLFKELMIAISGSFFLGFAGLFLSLIVGVYV